MYFINSSYACSTNGFVNKDWYILVQLFNTSDIEIVQTCRKFFGFALPSAQLSKRAAKFENRLGETTAAADL